MVGEGDGISVFVGPAVFKGVYVINGVNVGAGASAGRRNISFRVHACNRKTNNNTAGSLRISILFTLSYYEIQSYNFTIGWTPLRSGSPEIWGNAGGKLGKKLWYNASP
jgi:hypothetical protein